MGKKYIFSFSHIKSRLTWCHLVDCELFQIRKWTCTIDQRGRRCETKRAWGCVLYVYGYIKKFYDHTWMLQTSEISHLLEYKFLSIFYLLLIEKNISYFIVFYKMLSCSEHVSSKHFSLRLAHYRVRNQTLTDWRNENVIRFECNGESRQCSAALR